MKLLLQLCLLITTISYCHANDEGCFLNNPPDTIDLSDSIQVDSLGFIDGTCRLKKSQLPIVIILPALGTVTDISIFDEQMNSIFDESHYCCQGQIFTLPKLKKGEYSISMLSCHVGGACSLIIDE